MPEFIQDDLTAYRTVIIHFVNEKAVRKFEKLLNIELPEKQKYYWYPKMKIEKYADKLYEDTTKNEPT
jgi:hypothetical protein